MGLERKTVLEAVVSTAAVGVSVVLIVSIGVTYSGLAGQGAFALIGSIVFFVLVMAAVGYWLSGQ